MTLPQNSSNNNNSNINDIFSYTTPTTTTTQNDSKGNFNSSSFQGKVNIYLDVFSNLNLNSQNSSGNTTNNIINYQNSSKNQNINNFNNMGQTVPNQINQPPNKIDTQKLLNGIFYFYFKTCIIVTVLRI